MKKRVGLTVFVILILLAIYGLFLQQKPLEQTETSSVSLQVTDQIAPESATGRTEQSMVTGNKWMVASANHYASEAGAEMLKQGGNAIDAMVATQLVLGLVEPQSSGIGGGAFLVYWDAKKQTLISFDGREMAPNGVTSELFLKPNGEPMEFYDAVVGGRSVGTPGAVKLMWETHQRLGKLPWGTLFQPALELARSGFIVSPRLAKLVAQDSTYLKRTAEGRAYFFNQNGEPIKAGQRLKNPDYADTLQTIAQLGAKGFYQGDIAEDIVKAVQSDSNNPGVLAMEDFSIYHVEQRETVCAPYREEYDICGIGLPSSGALTLGQIFGLLNHYPIGKMGEADIDSWRLFGDASRLAFADRDRYMADSDFVSVSSKGLMNSSYLAERAELLKGEKALTVVNAGVPPESQAMHYTDDESIELPSTSHFSIVDSERNVVSMTSSIENGFGSRLMVRGFLLNNQLTDFSFRTHNNGKLIANRIEPRKRPRSSMSPTIVMKNGEPYLAIGSPGGSFIIGYVAKTLVAYLDWGMSLQQAIDLPNMNNRFGVFELEKGTEAELWAPKLEAIGFKTQIKELNSGVQAIRLDKNQLFGAADPRREGKVIAE